ncbi:MAG: hypothetical protein Q7R97_04025, partial [Candidatus Daviesbacteria bacterium]|nr:hypothetical protein [Candidatus Daviesbacteria bacterium]
PNILKFKDISLGSRYVGLPIRKKFLIKVFLTCALLLATTPSGAGAADRHQNRIGRNGGNWPIPMLDLIYAGRSDSTRSTRPRCSTGNKT